MESGISFSPEYQGIDVREVVEPPYRIVYRVAMNQVDVQAVFHGAQLLRDCTETVLVRG